MFPVQIRPGFICGSSPLLFANPTGATCIAAKSSKDLVLLR
jgi:hypothetical protein